MDAEQSTLIRFDGVLHENHTFEPNIGWETIRAAHRPPPGNPAYSLELLDKAGEVILAVHPAVDFERGCTTRSDASRSVRVIAYLSLHPEARTLLFRYEQRVLFSRPIAEKPPVIRIDAVEQVGVRGQRHKVSWRATHRGDQALSFVVVYMASNDRVFPVARGLQGKTAATVDVSDLPGGDKARFAVMATDGVRSSFAVSKALAIKGVSPTVMIVSPGAEELLPSGQPVSLCGRAFLAGAALDETNLVWRVDGKEVDVGRCQTLLENLRPGKHKISLAYALDGKTLAEQAVGITIGKASKHEKQFAALVKRIDEVVKPDPTVYEMTVPPGKRSSDDECGCKHKY